ncbi:hypothetical protein SESBI_09419 [Sesbania bispinosa]|nr:hypothetical protein SESBI_09419 [Sesbania bispinosa]
MMPKTNSIMINMFDIAESHQQRGKTTVYAGVERHILGTASYQHAVDFPGNFNWLIMSVAFNMMYTGLSDEWWKPTHSGGEFAKYLMSKNAVANINLLADLNGQACYDAESNALGELNRSRATMFTSHVPARVPPHVSHPGEAREALAGIKGAFGPHYQSRLSSTGAEEAIIKSAYTWVARILLGSALVFIEVAAVERFRR